MKENRYSQLIPADVLKQIQTHLEAAAAALKPYALTLTPQDRQRLLIMGPKTLSFVERAFQIGKQHPEFLPSITSIPEFETDFNDARSLYAVRAAAASLQQSLEDTEMIAGSEAYLAALAVYGAIKTAATQKAPGAQALYADLKTRFPGHRRHMPQPSASMAA